MNLNIIIRETEGVTVLGLKGKIVLGAECNALRERVKHLLASNQKKILLDLGDVSFIDSAGVGTLVAFFTSTRAQGGTLKLVNLTKKFQETLQVTRLLTVFESFDDQAKAVASFQ